METLFRFPRPSYGVCDIVFADAQGRQLVAHGISATGFLWGKNGLVVVEGSFEMFKFARHQAFVEKNMQV